MQFIKLPIKTPPLAGYLHHAYSLSVAREHPDFNAWFYAHYIQLNYFPGNNWLNFYRLALMRLDFCPLIDYQFIKNQILLANKIDIIDFIINCLNAGYYTSLFIDEYYHPGRRAFKKAHLIHENLVYGYNMETSSFYVTGYNQLGDYVSSEIGFSILAKAYNVVEQDEPVKILRPNANISCAFDLQNVKDSLTDYVNSRNTSERNRMFNAPVSDCIYGAGIYKHLILYFEKFLKAKAEIDIRLLYIFWEHKKCMLARIQYLYDNKHLPDLDPVFTAYSAIEKETGMLKLLQIKYNLSPNNKLIQQIIAALQKMHNEEINVLNDLLKRIQ